MIAVDLSVGWQFDLVVGLPILALVILAAVVWANTVGRRYER